MSSTAPTTQAQAPTSSSPLASTPASSPPSPLPSHRRRAISPRRQAVADFVHEHRVAISASTTAITGNLLGYPFDSVKTRMQTFSYPTMGHCIRHTYATEGLRGFFRGILPQMATSSVFKTASFAAYVRAKSAIAAAPSVREATGESAAGRLLVSSFGGGFCSGVFTAFLTQPLELIKVLRQLQTLLSKQEAVLVHPPTSAVPGHPPPVPTAAAAAAASTASVPVAKSAAELTTYGMGRAILHARGPLGLFYGFTSHLLRESLGGAVYFSSYELSKYYLSPADGSPPNVLVHVAAGGICGLFAWTIIFPTDSVKSTIQKEALAARPVYGGRVWACARDMYRQGGLRMFYRGIAPTMVRAAPLHSLNWAVYEGVLRVCTKKEERGRASGVDGGVEY